MAILPYTSASDLSDRGQEAAWLVEGLWSEGAVGILGGEPKCCKSFLALDVAVAVSSGRPCLGRFGVARQGRVLLYAAEDASHIVKSRLVGITAARGVDLDQCDIQVITSERLRLDVEGDAGALEETIAALKPRLVILDPFVRLHRIDENSSAEVAVILEKLRIMQRRHGTAILVVHHAKKNGGSIRAGQALRGSSEFHAWGDSNLYMRRGAEGLTLTVEHRAAPALGGISITLTKDGAKLALEIVDAAAGNGVPEKLSPAERIEQALGENEMPLSLGDLREACGIRMATLCQTVKTLIAEGRVSRTESGHYTST